MPTPSLTYRPEGIFTNGLHSGAGALTRLKSSVKRPRGGERVEAWDNEGGGLGSDRSGTEREAGSVLPR